MKLLLSPLLLAIVSTAQGEAVVTTLDGRTLTGEVVAWDAKAISIKSADGEQQLPASALLDARWSRDEAPAGEALNIEFVDGTRFSYAELTMADRQAKLIGSYSDGPLEIPREAIRLIELQPPSPAIAKLLEEIGRRDLAGDALVVANRDGQSMDYLTGVVGDVSAEQADFEWDGESVPVKRSKIAAIVFYHPRRQPLPDAVCELSLVDGSRIAVRRLELKDRILNIETPAGVELAVPLDRLQRADFSAGKVAYLSDLKPSEVRWTPRVATPAGADVIAAYGLPRNDASYSGSPLSLLWKDDVLRSRRDVRTYNKGLAIRSLTELTYRLPEGMRRFVATAGIDPSSAGQGHVTLQIRADDRVLWEGAVDGQQAPVEIDVELAAARRLHFKVDYGENLDYGDRLHLVEARVTK